MYNEIATEIASNTNYVKGYNIPMFLCSFASTIVHAHVSKRRVCTEIPFGETYNRREVECSCCWAEKKSGRLRGSTQGKNSSSVTQ